ncbi:MAG TPA: alpha/beta hydrolase [Oligoflexia bacterium]|nr:alpha/beta hydrolase [Oligoflexia bacterium]
MIKLTILVLSLCLYACASKAPQKHTIFQRHYGNDAIKSELNQLLEDNYSQTQAISVYYMTNRKQGNLNNNCGPNTFGNDADNTVHYGQCRISVPTNHLVGDITFSQNPRASSHQNYKFLQQNSMQESELSSMLSSFQNDILVFIHGFNVPFEQAVLRAAQIKYDLKFKGEIVLVSWPAGANGSSYMIHKTYAENKNNTLKSYALIHTMVDVLVQSKHKAHILVHSMGHQVFLPGLVSYLQKNPDIAQQTPIFAEGVFHAPDIATQKAVLYFKNIQKFFDRTTVYCSHKDYAITASQLYNEDQRLGHCFNLENTDVINVSLLHEQLQNLDYLGHSYYASRALLGDLFQVLLNLDANKRLFIRKAEPYAPENYFLRP